MATLPWGLFGRWCPMEGTVWWLSLQNVFEPNRASGASNKVRARPSLASDEAHLPLHLPLLRVPCFWTLEQLKYSDWRVTAPTVCRLTEYSG